MFRDENIHKTTHNHARQKKRQFESLTNLIDDHAGYTNNYPP